MWCTQASNICIAIMVQMAFLSSVLLQLSRHPQNEAQNWIMGNVANGLLNVVNTCIAKTKISSLTITTALCRHRDLHLRVVSPGNPYKPHSGWQFYVSQCGDWTRSFIQTVAPTTKGLFSFIDLNPYMLGSENALNSKWLTINLTTAGKHTRRDQL